MTDKEYKMLCSGKYNEWYWKRYLRREIFEAFLEKSKNTYKISRFKKVFEILNFDLFKAQKEELKNIKKGLAGENYKVEKIILPEIIENAFFRKNIYIIQGIEVEYVMPQRVLQNLINYDTVFNHLAQIKKDRIVVKTFSYRKAVKTIKQLLDNGYNNDDMIINNKMTGEINIKFHKIEQDERYNLETIEIMNKSDEIRYKAIEDFFTDKDYKDLVGDYYKRVLKEIKNVFLLSYEHKNRKEYIKGIDLIKKVKDPINVLKY